MPKFRRCFLALVIAASAAGPAAFAGRGPSDADPEASLELGPRYGDSELSSSFAQGAPQQAAAALRAGKPLVALQLLPAHPAESPLRWLRALSLRAAGRNAEARRGFEELALAGGPLTDRALHLAASCALAAGDGAGAERLLAQISPSYVDADQVLLERARQLLRTRVAGPATAKAVEATLEPIFAGKVRADVASAHLLAGDAARDAGLKEEARAHDRAAWVDHPLSAAAESARDRDRRLGAAGPAGPAVATDKLVRRAELLIEAHRNREGLDQLARLPLPSLCEGGCPGDRTPAGFLKAALELLAPNALPAEHEPTPEDIARKPLEPADPLACRAKLDQGRALRKEHEYRKARAALSPVVLRCADPDVRARALYLLAQLESMSGRPTAGPLWEALARNFPQSTLADDALFNQAMALRRAGDLEGTRRLLRELVDVHLDSDLRSEALFRLFWTYLAENRPREGLTWLDQLASSPDGDGAEEERARYWRARVLLLDSPGLSDAEKAAGREAALADLTWLARERPLTYHGLLGRARLEEAAPERAAPLEKQQERQIEAAQARIGLHAGSLGRDPHFLAAVELVRLGLNTEAVKELHAVERAPARAAGELGWEPLTLLADLYARAGDLRNAHAVVRTELRPLLRHPAEPLALRAATLAYPLAFRDPIVRVAQAAAIPPDLLQALMREESALDPRALSSTGALGLTQVMPATARGVARRLRLRGFSTSHLLDPDLNIRIGGSYLGELYARFQHPALALASYNAGPGAVSGWMRARGALPLDVFVEEIPLEETRGYVKRCLRSFAAYQFLYGKGTRARLGQTLAAN